ncbi:MAG: hypothetical protein GY944_23430 [bacterium]|nr:hypothetical protein [bacterium]
MTPESPSRIPDSPSSRLASTTAAAPPTHVTEDLFLGAYLLSEGCSLATTELVAPGHVRFVFSAPASSDLEALVRTYSRGEAVVPVLALKSALTHLKDVMFARLRAQENERGDSRWQSRSRRSRR